MISRNIIKHRLINLCHSSAVALDAIYCIKKPLHDSGFFMGESSPQLIHVLPFSERWLLGREPNHQVTAVAVKNSIWSITDLYVLINSSIVKVLSTPPTNSWIFTINKVAIISR